MGKRQRVLKAAIVIVVAPIALALLVYETLQIGGLFIVFSLAFTALYLLWAFSKIAYDPGTIRQVTIPGAPDDIADLLKKTTTGGDLINVILVSGFQNDERLSQSDLMRYAKANGVTLTDPAIREYVLSLEKAEIIGSTGSPESYKKEYRLTDQRGKWCREAVSKCFPKRTIVFHVRNGLNLRRLTPFPQNESGTQPAASLQP